MSGTLTILLNHFPGVPGVISIRQDADEYLWDFSDSTFKATPITDYVVPTPDSVLPGVSRVIIEQNWTGLYQALWYETSAKLSQPMYKAVRLLDGNEVDDIANLQTAVAALPTAAQNASAVDSLLSSGHGSGSWEDSGTGGGTDPGDTLFSWYEYEAGHDGDPAYAVQDVTVVAYANSSAIGTPTDSKTTDETGLAGLYLNDGKYYLFRRKSGRVFTNPVEITVGN